MPNGGPDNCGTCGHNMANEKMPLSKRIFGLARHFEPFCRLRDLALPNPFWIYCANHPAQNEAGVCVPIGPVLMDATDQDFTSATERSERETLLLELAGALGGS